MFTNRNGHVWHMVLMVGVAGGAFWLGAGAGGALLLALLACAAMMVAMVWIAMSAMRAGTVDQPPVGSEWRRHEDAEPRDIQRRF